MLRRLQNLALAASLAGCTNVTYQPPHESDGVVTHNAAEIGNAANSILAEVVGDLDSGSLRCRLAPPDGEEDCEGFRSDLRISIDHDPENRICTIHRSASADPNAADDQVLTASLSDTNPGLEVYDASTGYHWIANFSPDSNMAGENCNLVDISNGDSFDYQGSIPLCGAQLIEPLSTIGELCEFRDLIYNISIHLRTVTGILDFPTDPLKKPYYREPECQTTEEGRSCVIKSNDRLRQMDLNCGDDGSIMGTFIATLDRDNVSYAMVHYIPTNDGVGGQVTYSFLGIAQGEDFHWTRNMIYDGTTCVVSVIPDVKGSGIEETSSVSSREAPFTVHMCDTAWTVIATSAKNLGRKVCGKND